MIFLAYCSYSLRYRDGFLRSIELSLKRFNLYLLLNLLILIDVLILRKIVPFLRRIEHNSGDIRGIFFGFSIVFIKLRLARVYYWVKVFVVCELDL